MANAKKKTKDPGKAITINTRVVPVSKLKPADYNPRKITSHALEGLKKSLEEFGYAEPIVWNERTGTIVGGHQRFDALVQLGATDIEVVVIDMDPVKERALNATLNNPAIQGTWDDGKLQALLEELQDAAPDAGFGEDFFEGIRLDELAATFDSFQWQTDMGQGEAASPTEGRLDALEEVDTAALSIVRVQCAAKDLPTVRSALAQAVAGLEVNASLLDR